MPVLPRPSVVLACLFFGFFGLLGCGGVSPEPAAEAFEADLFAEAAAEVHGELRPDCMAEHLREAIAQNEARRPLYAAASGGESERVSNLMIALERSSLVLAPRVDEPAAPYHAAGIPVVCDGVVSMSRAPRFEPLVVGAIAEAFSARNGDAMAAELREALGRSGPEGAATLALRMIDELAATPHRHCMVRHVLESVARIGLLAPLHERLARRAKVPSTLALEEDLLRAHFGGLGAAAYIDTIAAPLQARGVPVVCNDVPAIPLPASYAPLR
jgi:hypothetical protein